jgi:glycine cleavage system H protein
MDGFTYNNIFETKGIEYLAIIAFLLLLIPFWLLLNRKGRISSKIRKASGILSANFLNIPRGLFYSNNHTWTHLERSGTARVGLDDLLLQITGEVRLEYFRNPDEVINKGDFLAELRQNDKLLRIYSPISGKILHTNPLLSESPGMLNEDPYGSGWIVKIKPSNWVEETKSYFLADAAVEWSARELDRFKDFLSISMGKCSPEPAMVNLLQDGGELSTHALSAMPEEIWQDFQEEFLNQTL